MSNSGKNNLHAPTEQLNGTLSTGTSSAHSPLPDVKSVITTEKITDVAVGVIERADGTILFGQRPEGKPWGGWWELPGGKLEPGETATQALKRELQEELGIVVTESRPWVTRVHHYPTTTVRLAFHRVTAWQGEPQGLENQALQWLSPTQALQTEHLLPATYPPLKWLSFPDYYAITAISAINPHPSTACIAAFFDKLNRALTKGIRLLQWREPNWSNDDPVHQQTFNATLQTCRQSGARLMVNSVHPQTWWKKADGVQLRQRDAAAMQNRPALSDQHWVAVSTHSIDELNHAHMLDADFVTLSPVMPTTSHPGAPHLGWEVFESLQAQAGIPVYALGGLAPSDLLQARRLGGHGVAGIGQFLV
jgi:8-oxo-dGTP diphosphatase